VKISSLIIAIPWLLMKVSYPASNLQSKLSDSQLALKIARHSPCSICDCGGLNPPHDVQVVLDDVTNESSLDVLGQYGSDDEETQHLPYLETCACSHGVLQHNAEESDIGRAEFLRRSRVAIRLDELLQVSPKKSCN
jgi:histone acetyltransferase